MKTSLEWLNSYLDKPVAADEFEQLLTALGLPVENREERPDGDTVLEVEVTSNRPDCLCHWGLAREVVAGSDRTLVSPEAVAVAAGGGPVEQQVCVRVDDATACPVYTARVIRGVKIGPSPDWMVRRLEAVGLRSVNNVVDVTNYVMLAWGQPLHAFDLAKLRGAMIVVRGAEAGEAFSAIDGSKHKLQKGMLVIADAQRPVAVAGVMGGSETEVGPGTTDVLLESAMFAPLAVRQTSRALKLASDSSYRFERGVDPVGVEATSRRAAEMLVACAGGELAQGVLRVGAAEPQPRAVVMRVKRCRALLGMKVKGKAMLRSLGRLGLQPRVHKHRKSIVCTVPAYRLDLTREVDLIEEVGRLEGLEKIAVSKKIAVVVRPVQAATAGRARLRQTLLAHGYFETVNFSFLAPAQAAPFLAPGEEALLVDAERRAATPMLRPSLLPSLLLCRKGNQDVGNRDLRLFEVGATWCRRNGAIAERPQVALLRDAEDPAAGLRDLRGTLEELTLLLAGSGARLEWKPAEVAYLAPAAAVVVGGRTLGVAGVLGHAVQSAFQLHAGVVLAELELPALLAGFPPAPAVAALPRFPGIERDLSVVVDEAVTWEQVEAQVRATGPELLEDLTLVTVYRGKPVPRGRKSVTLRMRFRHPQATLRHEQVDPQVAAVVAKLQQTVGAELRA
jgi:phenylalanyl-tRNA synthetase beta chain